MILLLDTSTPVCKLSFADGEQRISSEWESGRELAKGLLGYIQEQLHTNDKNWDDISGIVAFQGPGSFTGLRIGLTVLNTLADASAIPIVGTTGNDWQETGLLRLAASENDRIVLPEYGGEPHITQPRK